MIGWPFAHTCAARCPYCFVHDNMTKWADGGGRWWTDDEAVAGWAALADQIGPCHIIMSGLEPGEQLPLVARVLEHHKGAMLTNMQFDIDELRRLVPQDRLRLHPSFHPHLWGRNALPFLSRVRALQNDGYFVLQAAVVAWPPYLADLAAWREEFAVFGLRLLTIPFQGRYRDAQYPKAYTEEERALVYAGTSPALEHVEEPRVACAAGHACAYVVLDGSVWRCSAVQGMGDQNLFRDKTIRFHDKPMPCRRPCPCTQFHMYHIPELAEDGQRAIG